MQSNVFGEKGGSIEAAGKRPREVLESTKAPGPVAPLPAASWSASRVGNHAALDAKAAAERL